MKGKRVSIDQKLSSILSFICERDNFNPQTLESNDDSNVLTHNVKEMEGFRFTIEYLKDYAKLQAVSKSLGNKEGLKEDIENAQADFKKMIEEKEEEIKHMPRPSKRRVNPQLYDYGEEFKEIEENRYKKACEERKVRILFLKSAIKIYEGKIKKLESLKKSMDKPQELMKKLFPDEYLDIKMNYARLVNLCVASMTNGFSEEDLIGDDKVFKYDGKKYTVNYHKARSFLAVLKSKKEILSADEYIKLKQDRINKEKLYNQSVERKKEYENSYETLYTEEFSWITEKMNDVIDINRELSKKEENNKNSFITKLSNRFRTSFKLPEKNRVTRKERILRRELSSKIAEIASKTKEDEAYKKAFDAYQVASKAVKRPYFNNVEEMEWTIPEIKNSGLKRVTNISKENTNEVFLRIKVKKACEFEKEYENDLSIEVGNAKTKEAQKYLKLTSKTKKIMEKESEENILKYAKRYYGVGVDRNEKMFEYNENLSPSSAAIILESILGRKSISWESIVENYSSIIGKHNLEREGINMKKIVEEKVDSLKQGLVTYAQRTEKSNEGR